MADEPEGGLPEEATAEEIDASAEEVSQVEEPEEAQESDDPNNPGEESDDFVELLIGDKAEKLTVKRLTRGNPTMKAKFAELESDSSTKG